MHRLARGGPQELAFRRAGLPEPRRQFSEGPTHTGLADIPSSWLGAPNLAVSSLWENLISDSVNVLKAG